MLHVKILHGVAKRGASQPAAGVEPGVEPVEEQLAEVQGESAGRQIIGALEGRVKAPNALEPVVDIGVVLVAVEVRPVVAHGFARGGIPKALLHFRMVLLVVVFAIFLARGCPAIHLRCRRPQERVRAFAFDARRNWNRQG